MSECDNPILRELLPDALHDRLERATRERVLAHVSDCADCTLEWRVLQNARASMERSAPRVDSVAIARAVQARLASDHVPALRLVHGAAAAASSPETRQSTLPGVRRRGWAFTRLQAAAAALVVAVGGAVAVSARRDAPPAIVAAGESTPRGADAPTTQPALASPDASLGAVTDEPAGTPAVTRTRRVLAIAGEDSPQSALGSTFADLSDDELAAVLRAVDAESGALAAEPAPAPTLVTPGGAR